MDVVLRGAITYFALWLIIRAAGKRALADITVFDFVLMLIISETAQSSLTDDNKSITCTLLLVTTLVGIDIGLSLLKQRFELVEKIVDGVPLVIVEDGRLLEDRLKKARVDVGDILDAARELQGLERLEQIKYAVLERNGAITIVPRLA